MTQCRVSIIDESLTKVITHPAAVMGQVQSCPYQPLIDQDQVTPAPADDFYRLLFARLS